MWGQGCFTTDSPICWLAKTSMSLFHCPFPKFPGHWTKAKQQKLPAEPGAPPARPVWRWRGTPPTFTLHHCINPVARTPTGEEIQHLTD